ncbi:MAG: hypothetical protein ACRETL_06695, partial [Gammaproteobacteria bacterium]
MTDVFAFRPSQTCNASEAGKFPIQLHVVSRAGDLRRIFRIRYQAYHDAGHIAHDTGEQWSEP